MQAARWFCINAGNSARLNVAWVLTGLLVVLAGCTTVPLHHAQENLPLLKLTPASFAGTASLVQRLVLVRSDGLAGNGQSFDAVLEVDPRLVHLAGFVFGQRVMTLAWDGQRLQAEHDPRLPEIIDPERVLRDVQFVYWPDAAIRAALPPAWLLHDDGMRRTLAHAGQIVLVASYGGEARLTVRTELENRREGYRLTIESALAAEGSRP